MGSVSACEKGGKGGGVGSLTHCLSIDMGFLAIPRDCWKTLLLRLSDGIIECVLGVGGGWFYDRGLARRGASMGVISVMMLMISAIWVDSLGEG